MLLHEPWYTQFNPHPEGTNCFDRKQSNSAACSVSYENSTVFLMSLGQFLVAALVFNKGPPFRRPIYTNIWLLLGKCQVPLSHSCGFCQLPVAVWGTYFLACVYQCASAVFLFPAAISFQTMFLALLILAPPGPVAERFAGLRPFPFEFRGKLCLLLLVNLLISWGVDGASSALYHWLKGRRLWRWIIS
jgi:hypothetical protein